MIQEPRYFAMLLCLCAVQHAPAYSSGSGVSTESLPSGARTRLGGMSKNGKSYSHADCVYSTTFSRAGILISTSRDGTVIWWNAERGKAIRKVAAKIGGIVSLSLCQNGAVLAVGGEDGRIRLLDARTGQLVRQLGGHQRSVVFLGSSAAHQLISVSKDGTIRHWDLRSGRVDRTIETGQPAIWCAASTSDGRFIIVGDEDGLISIWSLKNSQCCRKVRHRGGVSSLVFSTDGKVFLSGGVKGVIRMWDLRSGETIGLWQGHKDAVTSLVFPTSSMRFFASVSYDGVLHGWDFCRSAAIASLQTGPSPLWTISYSRHEQLFATGSDRGELILWTLSAVLPKQIRPKARSTEQVEELWHNLQSTDVQKAYDNIIALLTVNHCAKFLSERLSHSSIDGIHLKRMLTCLSSTRFQERKRAVKQLEAVRFEIVGSLEKEAKTNPSIDVRKHLQSILDKQEELTPRQLQLLRGVQVLEYLQSDEGTACLTKLANRNPASRLAREAQSALDRIKLRATPQMRRD